MVAETSHGDVDGRSPAAIAWGRLRKKKLAMAALVLLVTLYSLGIFAPLVTGALGKDYSDQNLLKSQHGPDAENWFGTDRLGRDIFTRVIWGVQTTVIITFVTTLTGSLILGSAWACWPATSEAGSIPQSCGSGRWCRRFRIFCSSS